MTANRNTGRLAVQPLESYPGRMEAILPILIFLIVVLAANWVEFGRPD